MHELMFIKRGMRVRTFTLQNPVVFDSPQNKGRRQKYEGLKFWKKSQKSTWGGRLKETVKNMNLVLIF